MGAAKSYTARAFVDAAYAGDAKAVQAMLQAGMLPDTAHRGATALMVATSQGHARVVQALLRAGADPNAQDSDDLSLLVQAIRSESLPVVRALLKAGADVNCVELHDGSRETALMTAAMYGNLTLVQLLVEAGAEVNARSAKGDSALDLARLLRREKLAEFLQAAGAEERPRQVGKRSSK
jgi:uncharacterized protein